MGHGYYDEGIRGRVVDLVRGGLTAAGAARLVGCGPTTARDWCRAAGAPVRVGRPGKGAPVASELAAADRPPRTSPRSRLTLADRAAIREGLRSGRSLRAIARDIGFSHTTVAREVRRGSERGRYEFSRAQRRAERAALRPRPRRLESEGALRAYVAAGLLRRWSPRQISGRMRLEFPDNGAMRVSHETIYQALYVQGRGALRHEPGRVQALRSGRRGRRPRSRLPQRPGRGWCEGCEISLRPPEAADRAVPGHWEGDLVVGGDGRSCLVTLVERRTRFLVARRLPGHESRTVVDLLVEMVASVPDGVRGALLSTLTWDQGVEMAEHARFTEAKGFRVYFCDPHSPWQRGTNENTNGLLRQFFPKGTEFADVTDGEVREAQDLLNGRPRETLGWRTPAEALAEELAKAGAMAV